MAETDGRNDTVRDPVAQDGGAAEASAPARFAAGQDPVKRDQILDGAARVFSRMGFDAAGMADITREAAVSKGTIYVYFGSKDELFVALVNRERELMFRDMSAILDIAGTPAERLQRYGRALARKLCSDQVIQAHRVIIGICSRKPEIGAAFYEGGPKRGVGRLRGFFAAEIAAGRMRDCDTERAAQQFVELCLSGLFKQRLMAFRPSAPSDEEIAANVEAALQMFQAFYFRPA